MSDGVVPVIAGLAAGIGLIATFILLSSQFSQAEQGINPPTENIVLIAENMTLQTENTALPVVKPPESRVWVAKNTTQCDEPWQFQIDVSQFFPDNQVIQPWQREKLEAPQFFANKQVMIFDLDQAYYLEPNLRVCTSCNCISGWTLYLKVDSSDVPAMQEYGFVVQAP